MLCKTDAPRVEPSPPQLFQSTVWASCCEVSREHIWSMFQIAFKQFGGFSLCRRYWNSFKPPVAMTTSFSKIRRARLQNMCCPRLWSRLPLGQIITNMSPCGNYILRARPTGPEGKAKSTHCCSVKGWWCVEQRTLVIRAAFFLVNCWLYGSKMISFVPVNLQQFIIYSWNITCKYILWPAVVLMCRPIDRLIRL